MVVSELLVEALLRTLTRHSVGESSYPPPRITLPVPEEGPLGFICADIV